MSAAWTDACRARRECGWYCWQPFRASKIGAVGLVITQVQASQPPGPQVGKRATCLRLRTIQAQPVGFYENCKREGASPYPSRLAAAHNRSPATAQFLSSQGVPREQADAEPDRLPLAYRCLDDDRAGARAAPP